jgi:hypothetical protein
VEVLVEAASEVLEAGDLAVVVQAGIGRIKIKNDGCYSRKISAET